MTMAVASSFVQLRFRSRNLPSTALSVACRQKGNLGNFQAPTNPHPEEPAKRASRRALVAGEHPSRPFAFDKGRLRMRSVELNPAIFAACLDRLDFAAILEIAIEKTMKFERADQQRILSCSAGNEIRRWSESRRLPEL